MKLEKRKNHTHMRIKHTQSTKSKNPLHHKHNNKHEHENIPSQKNNIKEQQCGNQWPRVPSEIHSYRTSTRISRPGTHQPTSPSPLPYLQKTNTKTPDRNNGKYPPPRAGVNPSRPTQLLTHIRLQLADVTLSSDYPRGGVSQPHIVIINHSRDDHRLGPA